MLKTEGDDGLTIAGVPIPSGRRTDVELNVTRLPTGTWVSVPVVALRGKRPGPRLWISAAIHGDELNGVEIVRRLLPLIPLDGLRGTVIAVPVVNVLGFLNQDRYLPDRRDLNRSFPGSARGSLAAQMAHLFMSEIVIGCQFGIDLHTGSNHRINYPQVRANLDDPGCYKLAEAFAPPLVIHSNSRDGSLRQVSAERGCPVIVYEAGETLRFDRKSIQVGVNGIQRALKALGMLDRAPQPPDEPTRFFRATRWTRTPRGGILLLHVSPGEVVESGQPLATVSDTFSTTEREIRAPCAGVVVGLTNNPLVNRGDAVVHLAIADDPSPNEAGKASSS